MPQNRIVYIDGCGTLKTTIKHDRSTVRLRIGDKEHEAIASDGSFAVESGQLAFAPGSNGWTNAQGEEMRWMELFLRGIAMLIKVRTKLPLLDLLFLEKVRCYEPFF